MKLPRLEYTSREKYLLEAAKGKQVLHLGCVGDRALKPSERTLHERLSVTCKDLWGVDTNEKGLEVLREKLPSLQSKLLKADASKLHELNILPSHFELVIAGDLIEHLTSPADLFLSCRAVLADRGILILTTPNALGILTVLRAWNGQEAVNPNHTCWFSVSTLNELARRMGWQVQKYLTCYDVESHGRAKVFLGSLFFRLFPQWGGTLIAVAKPMR